MRCPKSPSERTSGGEMNPRDAQKVFFKCDFLRKLGKSVVKPGEHEIGCEMARHTTKL